MVGKGGVVAVILATVVGFKMFKSSSAPERPPLPAEKWWGYGSPTGQENTSVRKFKVNVPKSVLDDLKTRLNKTRLTADLEEGTFEYGFQEKYMRGVLEHWKHKYDWRKHEETLNSFPQFITNIDGIDVHFIHAKPTAPAKKVYPLLLVHGWPGSVWEFHKILPLLTTPDENGVAFEVICPSLPGYGFSEQPHKKGFDAVAAATVFNKLMSRLGHERFYLQGGDWGSLITLLLSRIYPEKIKGVHINMATPQTSVKVLLKQLLLSVWPSALLSESELENWKGIGHMYKTVLRETGYFHLQATRPDTPAFALNDSPVGLAAYIMEKFSVWTHSENYKKSDGGMTEFFTLDEVLTNVMIYWLTESIGSSMRLYKEYVRSEDIPLWDQLQVTVPAGIASFPHDLSPMPKTLVEGGYKKLIHYTEMPRGGHFAAMQEPQLLADDFRKFVQKVEAIQEPQATQ